MHVAGNQPPGGLFGGGDVGGRRQQQVILAVRDKVLEPETFTNLISQPTTLCRIFLRVRTNLPLEDAIRMVVLAKDIHVEDIRQGVIDTTMAIPTIRPSIRPRTCARVPIYLSCAMKSLFRWPT